MSDIKVKYIRRPLFYKDFYCTGDKCPVNCCYGWGVIGWEKNEYEKLKNTQMSDNLRSKFEYSFKPVTMENYKKNFDYQIEYTEERKCPMLAEGGLCMIQKELGEEYLSFTCRIYPRVGKVYGNILAETCQCSCNQVISMLCNNEDSMKLENIASRIKLDINCSVKEKYSESDFINYPALKCEKELFEFFYEVLSDNSRSIETSLVLSAMAAQKIDEFIKKGEAEKIPEIIKALKPQLNNTAQIKKLENAKPNLSLKANISAALLKLLRGASIYEYVFENGVPSEEKWNKGLEIFNSVFGGRPYALKNIVLNLFIAEQMPYKDITLSLYENLCVLAAETAVVKFLGVAVAAKFEKERCEEFFYIAVSNIDRVFSHNKDSIKNIIAILNAIGITSPAYLMGILR